MLQGARFRALGRETGLAIFGSRYQTKSRAKKQSGILHWCCS